jgi:hypothetical protein
MQTRPQLLTLLLLASAVGACAQVGLQTRSIHIYKNGASYIQRSGKVNTESGRYILRDADIPGAAAGSIWFSSKDGIINAERYRDSMVAPKEAISLPALLKANIGKQAIVITQGEPPQRHEGTIEKLYGYEFANLREFGGSWQLGIRTSSGWKVLQGSDIRAVEWSVKPNDSLKQPKAVENLAIRFKGQGKEKDLGITYLSQSLSWHPSYRLELLGNDEASLVLQAEVANAGPAFEGASLNLVIGQAAFSEFGREALITQGIEGNVYKFESEAPGFAYDNRAVSFERFADGDGSSDFSGSAVEDFYMYSLQNTSMRRSSVMQYRLLEGKIKTSHVYETELAVNRGDDNVPYSAYPYANQENLAAMHRIRFTNTLGAPLTAAPVMIESADKDKRTAIGQSPLRYTPNGAVATVDISTAPDIVSNHTESESARKEQVRANRDQSWDLLTVDATLEIRNYSNKTVRYRASRLLHGNPLSCSEAWKTESLLQMSGGLNKWNKLSWETDLKPGEARKITYRYEVYVRSM